MKPSNNGDPATESQSEQTARIRMLNDRLRKGGQGGWLCISNGIVMLGHEASLIIREAIASFDQFGPDNDPYNEHDFGAIEFAGERILWKIDYYDKNETYASPDPADPSVTTRILTIMLASEY